MPLYLPHSVTGCLRGSSWWHGLMLVCIDAVSGPGNHKTPQTPPTYFPVSVSKSLHSQMWKLPNNCNALSLFPKMSKQNHKISLVALFFCIVLFILPGQWVHPAAVWIFSTRNCISQFSKHLCEDEQHSCYLEEVTKNRGWSCFCWVDTSFIKKNKKKTML